MITQPFPFADPLTLEESDLGLQALFQSFLPTNANPVQQQQFGSLFQPTFGSFLGQLGAQIKQGKAPDLTFNQFLTEQFNPTRALLRLPGAGASRGPTIFRF